MINNNLGHYFINDNNLKSDIKEFSVKIKNNIFRFKTDNGVFSKGELDYGTEYLINTLLNVDIKGDVLDLGCGYGAIGIILNKILNVSVDMIDINKRAIHLAKLNSKDNQCKNIYIYESDGYNLVDKKFDYIVSNPPIRVGKKILYQLISDSKKYLKYNGKIYLVVRKEQGAKTLIKDFNNLYNIEIIDKKKGFVVICLKK